MISIFTKRFFDFVNMRPNLGGTQTYFTELARVLTDAGYDVTILDLIPDKSTSPRCCTFNGASVMEYCCGRSINKSFKKYYKNQCGRGIYIIGDDTFPIYPHNLNNVISIQHGIAWDNSRGISGIRDKALIFPLFKIKRSLHFLKSYICGAHYVCVDYNYYNWLKTLYDIPKGRLFKVIPNFTSSKITEKELGEKLDALHSLDSSRIVFARRFYVHRGPVLWARVVCRLAKEFPNVSFVFAGEGPYDKEMRDILMNINNVFFTKYNTEESVSFHKEFDIAVIPTLYSEGTSLSLCEAMAAGCLPIATYVGGLSNILIDGYNGFLSFPSEEDFYRTVRYVLTMNIDVFKSIVKKAYESSTIGFSKEQWASKWLSFISQVENNEG